MCVRIRYRALLAMALVTVAITILIPASASATIYTWNSTNGGLWANRDHWTCDINSGPCGDFPNARGDIARFPANVPAGVAIGIDRDIVVGSIQFDQFGDTFLSINTGRLIFDNGA